MEILIRSHIARGGRKLCAIILVLSSLGAALQASAQQGASEYEVKAVFLHHFFQFVQWPDSAFSDSSSPYIVGVLGDDPFGHLIDEALQGDSVGGRPIHIRRYEDLQAARESHLLYIAETDEKKLKKMLDNLRNQEVLTVSDVEGFGSMGGMIELAKNGTSLKLKINHQSAKDAKLQISSRLLKLAEIISTDNESGK